MQLLDTAENTPAAPYVLRCISRTFTAPLTSEEQATALTEALAELLPLLEPAAAADRELGNLLENFERVELKIMPPARAALAEKLEAATLRRFVKAQTADRGTHLEWVEREDAAQVAQAALAEWESTPEGFEVRLAEPALRDRLFLLEQSISRQRLKCSQIAEEFRAALGNLATAIDRVCTPSACAEHMAEYADALAKFYPDMNTVRALALEAPLLRVIRHRWNGRALGSLEAMLAIAECWRMEAEAILAGKFVFTVTTAESAREAYHAQRRVELADDYRELEEQVAADNERTASAAAVREEKRQAVERALEGADDDGESTADGDGEEAEEAFS